MSSSPCRFIAAKFSPLIHTRSTLPPCDLPAAFSAATLATAVAVSSELDLDDIDPEPPLGLASDPFQIAVDGLVAAPGVEVDRLAFRLAEDLRPIGRARVVGLRRESQRQQRGYSDQQAVHATPPGASSAMSSDEAFAGDRGQCGAVGPRSLRRENARALDLDPASGLERLRHGRNSAFDLDARPRT